ncbi:hypothetical protein EPN18_05480 [bacterium]|nr:MAG: hypothetical protein EPN18_05480 [bacterium]
MTARQRLIAIFLITTHFSALVLGMIFRFIDGDEGGMLVVTKEVINGRVPVLDINAHNQPLMYYFYGLWMKVFGFGIISARSLSVAVMFGAGLLLFWWAWRFTKNFGASAILYFLFITNLTFFKTNIPVKPFALSNFFIFAAFATLSVSYLKHNKLKTGVLFFTGLLVGASLGVRLIFMLPFAYGVWIIFVAVRDKAKFKATVAKLFSFGVGVTIPMLPSVWMYIKEPLRAYTIWAGAYAQIYLGKGSNPDFAVDAVGGKTEMILTGLIDIINVPDNVFLLAALVISTVMFFSGTRRALDKARVNVYALAWLILTAILYIYSNLYGNYLGYVNQVVLFIIVLSFPLAMLVSTRLGAKVMAVLAVVFIALSTVLFYVHFQKRLNTSIFYFTGSTDVIVTPAYVNTVAENVVRKYSKEGDKVFDTWGVFVFASGRKPVTGFEYPTDNAFFWALMKNKENASKYLFIPEPEIFRQMEKKEIPVVVLGDISEYPKISPDNSYAPGDLTLLRVHVEKHYVLVFKGFVKPTNAWVLIYVPKAGS